MLPVLIVVCVVAIALIVEFLPRAGDPPPPREDAADPLSMRNGRDALIVGLAAAGLLAGGIGVLAVKIAT